MANALRQFMGALETNRCAVMLLSPERTAEVADCTKHAKLVGVLSLLDQSKCEDEHAKYNIKSSDASILQAAAETHLCLKRIAFKVPLIPALI